MRLVNDRDDIQFLVNTFYGKVREDELIGPVFNSHIPDDMWPEHLSKLADFWETNLFGIAKFKGNPTKAHLTVDKNMNHSIQQEHFGAWLQLWFETIDENFEGDLALKAKESARRMAHKQFMMIWGNREGS